MVEWASLTNHFPYFGLFILLILGGIGLPFPEDATLLLSGLLVSHDVIKPLQGFLVVYSGLLMTDFFLYLVGKKYGRRVAEHNRLRKIISPDRFSKLEEKFEKWGSLVVFFGRHILGLRAQIFLAAGVMRMSAMKFLGADAISALITMGLWGSIGYLGGNSIQVLRNDIRRIEHVAIVIFLIFLVIGIFFWYFRNKGKFRQKGI